ncbi:MAG: uncharacterized protein QOE00_1880 [Ilumatobacteraceae bacterium]
MDTAAPRSLRIEEIWRYPVKSLQGERLSGAILDDSGLRGDRRWGVRDETTGKILTGRREPKLLLAAASLADDGEPEIVLPSGEVCRGLGSATDTALSEWLERPVTLVGAVGSPAGEAEFFADATDDASEAIAWTMPPDRFVDAMPLLLLTTASLRSGAVLHPAGDWSVRRFRPNLLIDADGDEWLEDTWCGFEVHIGSAVVVPRQGCVRCTMVTRPQPELVRDLEIYKTLARHHGGTFGVWTQVNTPGDVHVNDAVTVAT